MQLNWVHFHGATPNDTPKSVATQSSRLQPSVICTPQVQPSCSTALVPNFSTLKSGMKGQVSLETIIYRASWFSVLTLLSVHHELSLKTTVELLVMCGRGSNFSVYLTVFRSKLSECWLCCWRRQLLLRATWLSGLIKPSQLCLMYVLVTNYPLRSRQFDTVHHHHHLFLKPSICSTPR